MNEKEIEKIRKRFFVEFPVPYVQRGDVLTWAEKEIKEAYELGRATGHLEASAENSFMAAGTMEAL